VELDEKQNFNRNFSSSLRTHHSQVFVQSTPPRGGPQKPPIFETRERDLEERKRRQRNQVILAGSSLGRGFRKLPQQAAREKKVQLKPTQIKPLCCPHGIELTPEEYEVNRYAFSNPAKKKADKINNSESNGVNLVLLRSSTCLRCNPVCDHNQPMSEAEVAEALVSGTRFSSSCAACTNSKDPEEWERILKSAGLARDRGMSPAKFVISAPDGVTHSRGQGKNLQTGNDIDKRDAASTVSRDDVPARSRKPKGYGSDTSADDEAALQGYGSADAEANPDLNPLAELRVREIQEIKDIDISGVGVACEAHGVNFCRKCFSKTDIQTMKEEVAEIKSTSKREREIEEREDPPEFDEDLQGEGRGRKDQREDPEEYED
jgi:hypothetical protein